MKHTLLVLINMGSLHRLAPFLLMGVILIVVNPSWWVIPALAYGVMLQFFVEYVMHRFLYHRQPPTDQGVFNELYRSHLAHHEFPTDAEYFTGGAHWFAVRFGRGGVGVAAGGAGGRAGGGGCWNREAAFGRQRPLGSRLPEWFVTTLVGEVKHRG